MYSSVIPLEKLAQRSMMYFLPPGGRDNGLWADTWVIIADIETEHVTAVLDLLAEADVGGYATIPHGPKARADGRYHLYVDTMRYHRAEDVLMVYLRGKPRPDAPRAVTKTPTTRNARLIPQSRMGAAVSRLATKDATRKTIWVLIGAALIALVLAGAYYIGPTYYPSACADCHRTPSAPPQERLIQQTVDLASACRSADALRRR